MNENKRSLRERFCLLCAAVLFTFLPNFATATEWDALSEAQQRVLQRHQEGWSALPEQQQQSLALGAERWLSMNPEQRQRFRQRYQRWQTLSPDQQDNLKKRLNQFRSLPPEQQRAIRERMRRFNALPPERKKALRQRFQQLSPEERARALQRMRDRRMRVDRWRDRGTGAPRRGQMPRAQPRNR